VRIWEDSYDTALAPNIRVVSYSTADEPKHHLVSNGTIFVTRTTHEQLQVRYDTTSYGKVQTPKQLLSSYGTFPPEQGS